MIDPVRVRVSGPLAPFAAGFAAELTRQGCTPKSASLQLQLMAHVSRWLAAQALDPGALSPVTAERFLAACRAAGYAEHRSEKALRPLLVYLRGLGVTPRVGAPVREEPVEALLCRYHMELPRLCGAQHRRGNSTRPPRAPGKDCTPRPTHDERRPGPSRLMTPPPRRC